MNQGQHPLYIDLLFRSKWMNTLRLVPAVNRFPSSEGGKGFKPLADYVHNLGLKFGIHIMRGIPRQAVHANTPILGTDVRAKRYSTSKFHLSLEYGYVWGGCSKEGAQEYYNSLFQLYSEWGVDFVKVDDIAASRLYHIHQDEIKLIARQSITVEERWSSVYHLVRHRWNLLKP